MSDTTPVTDDDRQAHEWAKQIDGVPEFVLAQEHATARAIRAHVPAPPATLADELRAWGKHPAAFAVSTELLALADRVEAVEKHNEEVIGIVDDLTEQRDDARAEVASLSKERDEVRAEVGRLTQKLDEVTAGANFARQNVELLSQKIGRDEARPARTIDRPEGLDALPDPADVPPGEPWLVEFNGERRIALRSDPDDCKAWYLPSRDLNREGAPWVRDIELALVARLVPEVTA